jgi:uncharacterized membrane protein
MYVEGGVLVWALLASAGVRAQLSSSGGRSSGGRTGGGSCSASHGSRGYNRFIIGASDGASDG